MLNNLDYFAVLVSFVCGLITYNRLPKAYKWLTFYQLFAFCYELAIANRLLIWNHTNSSCNNMEGIVELLVFTHLLASFSEFKPYKKTIFVFERLVLLFTIIDIAFIQGFFKLATIATVVQGIFLLILVFAYYYLYLKNVDEAQKLITNPNFLMATGLLLYQLGTTFFYACFSSIAYNHNPTFLTIQRIIPSSVNIIFNILIIAAFLCFLKKNRLSHK
jgi:hypothetical protein